MTYVDLFTLGASLFSIIIPVPLSAIITFSLVNSTGGTDDLDSIGDLGEHGRTTRLDLVHLPECVPLSTSGWLASLNFAVGDTLLLCLHLDICVPCCQLRP
jgi:hypothetical protein